MNYVWYWRPEPNTKKKAARFNARFENMLIHMHDGDPNFPSECFTSLAFWLGQDAEGIKLMKIIQIYLICSDETGVTVDKVEIGQDENCPTNWYWRDGASDYVLTPSPWNGPFYSKRAAYTAACLEKEPHFMVSN